MTRRRAEDFAFHRPAIRESPSEEPWSSAYRRPARFRWPDPAYGGRSAQGHPCRRWHNPARVYGCQQRSYLQPSRHTNAHCRPGIPAYRPTANLGQRKAGDGTVLRRRARGNGMATDGPTAGSGGPPTPGDRPVAQRGPAGRARRRLGSYPRSAADRPRDGGRRALRYAYKWTTRGRVAARKLAWM